MQIGFIPLSETGEGLHESVDALMQSGLRIVGALQYNRPGGSDCDMELEILPSGPRMPISQDLGPGADSCRLDIQAFEQAVGEVAARLGGADLLVINKFGKVEAGGRGFRPLIGEALGAGIPVLIGVPAQTRAAFLAFADDLAQELTAAEIPLWIARLRREAA